MEPIISEVDVIDFGKIPKNKSQVRVFKLFNTTDQMIEVSPWSSCGCSYPSIETKKIPPGGESVLRIVFDPTGKTGLQEKMFGVTYPWEDGKNKTKRVSIILKAII